MALWSDVRHAVRSLRRARGFTAVAVGTLSASLALAVAVMAVVNAYLVRGLPYPESDRLFNVRYVAPGQDFPQGLEYRIVYDPTVFVQESVNAVIHTLIEAFILVFLVVFLFLQDFRSTLIPAIAVPVAIVGTFFFLGFGSLSTSSSALSGSFDSDEPF